MMAESTDCITVSAPGKIIFHGEHAVVYGKPAIAASLSLRTQLTCKTTTDQNLYLNFPQVNIDKVYSLGLLEEALHGLRLAGSINAPEPASDNVVAALRHFAMDDHSTIESKEILGIIAFLYMYCNITRKDSCGLPGMHVSVASDIPVGAGFGSSGAFSASLAAALLQFSGRIIAVSTDDNRAFWSPQDQDIINRWAYIGDKVIHGQPSGVDNTLSTFGGAIKFVKKENVPSITSIRMPTLSIMLVNTKVERSTKDLVSKFRDKYVKYHDICEPILQSMEAISNKSLELLNQIFLKPDDETCYNDLGDIIDMNQHLLRTMGVSHPSLEHIVTTAAKYGLHAKLTGAGGGGCAFVLIPPNTGACLDKLKGEFEDVGYQVWLNATVGEHGVCIHL